MKKNAFISLVSALFFCSMTSNAQYLTSGTEKPSVRWNTFTSANYRFIYPAGCDSLALSYARQWELCAPYVGKSIGFAPNCNYALPMPVVLHPYLGYSNGMVAWTPRRMEMFTGPDMYSPEPIPWTRLLAIHESRHVSQMQYLGSTRFFPYRLLTGENLAGPISTIYSEPLFCEGDAVATETALSSSGRGRTADFLEYMMASFDEGEMRDFYRWRYGSMRYFTPDYYKLGYLAMGGMRTYMGVPDFLTRYYETVYSLWPIRGKWDPLNYTSLQTTGMSFPKAVEKVMETSARIWKEEADSRAPFQAMERISEFEPYFSSYRGLDSDGGKLYAVKEGLAHTPTLVEIDPESRSETSLRTVGASSRLKASGGRVYWTGMVPDLRWERHSDSRLSYYENGRIREMGKGRRYFNPAPCGDKIALCETPADGSSLIRVISSGDASTLEEFRAPDGVLYYECVWVGDEMYAAYMDMSGQGICRVSGGFSPVLESGPVKLNSIFERGGDLYFVSDRSGVNELYRLDLKSSELFCLTNLRQGGKDFVFDGGYLYFTALTADGRMIYRTPEYALPERKVDFSERHAYDMADRLSALEPERIDDGAQIETSEPKAYSKLAHALRIHSWLPFYVDADNVAAMSFETVLGELKPGLAVMFQNNLGTLSGSAGLWVDPKGWTPGASAHFTYTGLYPVFDVKFDYSGAGAIGYARSYVPLNFSSNGWSRAVIPQVMLNFAPGSISWKAGIRGYAMKHTPSACLLPRLGIGAEAGIDSGIPYGLLYGYLPGFGQTHSIGVQINGVGRYNRFRALVRYAMPLFCVDWSGLEPFTYVRNFEFVPFYQYDHSDKLPLIPLNMHTVGASFSVVLGNILSIPYSVHLGVKYGYRFNMLSPHVAELLLSMDI